MSCLCIFSGQVVSPEEAQSSERIKGRCSCSLVVSGPVLLKKKDVSEKNYRNRVGKDKTNRVVVSWKLSIHKRDCHSWKVGKLDSIGRQGEVCRAGVVEPLKKVCGLGVGLKAKTGGQE